MSANTKIVVLRRKELLYTGIFAALGVLFVILLLMLLLPGKAADTSGAPDSPDSTAETVMPDNVADLGRIPQSAQTEDVSTGAVADTDAVLDNASGPAGTDNTYIPGIYTTELILGSETVHFNVVMYFGVQYRRWLFCIQLCGKDAFRRPESGDAGADGCGNSWIHGRYRRKRRGLHDAGRREKGTG